MVFSDLIDLIVLPMKYLTKLNLVAFFALLPLFSFAHEGHGVASGASMTHYLLSPIHAIPIIVIVAVVAIYFYRKKQTASK